MRYRIKLILWLAVLACLIGSVSSYAGPYTGKIQVPAENMTQIITLEDGSTLYGKITTVGDGDVKFQTDVGEMTIANDKIRNIEEIPISSIKDGEYWFPNPNRSRLLFGPTARTLKQGDGYFYDLWIFFPGIAYAITDNIMISGGASLIPEVDNQMYYIMPKIGFTASEKLDVAASLIVFRLMDQSLIIGLGNATYGTDDHSITAGLGFASTDDEMAEEPAGTIGGEYRLSRRTALVGESWFLPGSVDQGAITLLGIRFFGDNMAVDLGATIVTDNGGGDDGDSDDDEGTHWLPYIDFVWNF